MSRWCCLNIAFFIIVVLSLGMISSPCEAETQPSADRNEADTEQAGKKQNDPYAWKSLFDGKTLKDWKSVDFGGQGDVSVKNGEIILGCGESLTGIVFEGKPPRMNYEISLEAMRLDGSDFFATTTFPIGRDHCSLVVGGWGGTVVGLSNVDFYDAGDNITTRFVGLKTKKWYRVRIRVSKVRIEAWIDKEKIVDLPTEGHKFDTRIEVDSCQPLGIASWCTTAALRDIRIRRLRPEEVACKAEPPQSSHRQKIAKKYDFQAHGPIGVRDGAITNEPGSPASGIRWSGKFPRLDYEISLQAMISRSVRFALCPQSAAGPRARARCRRRADSFPVLRSMPG